MGFDIWKETKDFLTAANSDLGRGTKISMLGSDPATLKLYNDWITIQFYSLAHHTEVDFKAFVTNFTDSFNCSWNSQEAHGRMDPIQSFQSTSRRITIEWDVVASGAEEAAGNLQRCARLVQMLYPGLGPTIGTMGSAIEAPPYIRFKFGNLAAREGRSGKNVKSDGLLGTCSGIDYSPNFDAGAFSNGSSVFPKVVSLSVEMTVLHEHEMGIKLADKDSSFATFPWGTHQPPGAKVSNNSPECVVGEGFNASGPTSNQKAASCKGKSEVTKSRT